MVTFEMHSTGRLCLLTIITFLTRLTNGMLISCLTSLGSLLPGLGKLEQSDPERTGPLKKNNSNNKTFVRLAMKMDLLHSGGAGPVWGPACWQSRKPSAERLSCLGIWLPGMAEPQAGICWC